MLNKNTEKRIDLMIRLAYGPDNPEPSGRVKKPLRNPIKVGKNSGKRKPAWGGV